MRNVCVVLGFVLLGALSPVVASAQDPARVERARTLFMQSQVAYDAGRLDEALAKMREAYQLLESPDMAFNLARVYERMGDAENGIRYFRVYLQHATPSDAERADVERRIAALEEVQRRVRQQIIDAPPSQDALTAEARTFFLRGVAMFQRRRFEPAMEAFTAAYRFAPLPEVVYNLAVTAERLNRMQDAIDYYREYMRAQPPGPERNRIEAKIRELRARQGR